ncbi:glycyl-radical enzyme activating protein [Diplocloster agilis]|uniref:glycyl-radical enzyme activating protein n=1 Tax=Diplocloster agilis TaxID=2850323 RepID=UPI0008203931|nr:glycyl-radical enzyme activating protein [Suonthocola fibrivorans]MCU6737025.1 glycyl-radical enzyme activating protein [Suonthocola fibrivorans]SCJ95304.1 4-hydroxyphenylacetate decarboxylase activating enzyme [uncultured Clostridium sp.]
MTGRIFDIRRFSTHDGSGIRTTIFLKGCPLRCVWCQNPEGLSYEKRPLWFQNRCIGCGICLDLSRDLGVSQRENRIHLDISRKEDWEEIIDACPGTALQMDSRDLTVEETLEEALKDKIFFEQGGGITVSGGEPFLQPEFLKALLIALKERHVNTAVETSLHAPLPTLKSVLPYLDTIYADFKIYDSAAHQQHTGVTNETIRENLRYLLTSPDYQNRVIIRTPMIPGYTTGSDNIAQIARYITSLYPDVSYEILNYNPLAAGKYDLVDRTYCFTENPKLYTPDQMEAFVRIAHENSVKRLILDS